MDEEDDGAAWNDEGVDGLEAFIDGTPISSSQTPSQVLPQISDAIVPIPIDDNGEYLTIPETVLQNVIASVHLCTELDLRLIAVSARNAEYNPTKVNAVVIRLRNPKCTGLLFRSGRMMVTGARSTAHSTFLPIVTFIIVGMLYFWIASGTAAIISLFVCQDAHLGGKKMAKLCLKVGHPNLKFKGFKIENLIASADCHFPIRLEGLAHDHNTYCSYEPELFSGLVYRYHPPNSTKSVLLIFVSGKVIITGCATLEQVRQVFHAIFPVLCQYRK